jgi:hypothetical protein
MLRKLVILTFLLTAGEFLFAQNFHAGVIAGLSGTQVAGDNLSGFNKAGIIAGGFVNTKSSESTSLQMEIIFIQKGSRMPVQPDNDNHFYVLHVSYFEVPVLFKWQVVPKFNFEVGPSFGALVFSEEENEWGVINGMPPFKKFEFSGNVGLSYPLTEKLVLNSRFNNSILPIRPFADSPLNNFFNRGQYNTVLMFTIHYEF